MRARMITVQKRLEELEHEIAAMRAKIARSLKDEGRYFALTIPSPNWMSFISPRKDTGTKPRCLIS